jgi:hypothetical protein
LYDRRLAANGYSVSLLPILNIVLLSHFVFTAALIAYCVILRPARGNEGRLGLAGSSKVARISQIFLLAGWIGRLADLGGAPALATALSPFAAVGACVLILMYRGENARNVFIIVIASELLWTYLDATKTPLLAILTAYLIRIAYIHSTRAQAKRIPMLAGVVVVIFLIVQPLKGISTFQDITGESQGAPSSALNGITASVLERTDLISAVEDGYAYPNNAWMTDREFAQSLALASIPKGSLFPYENQGLRWTREVRSFSVENQYQDVSLASGPVAEGLAMGGPPRAVTGLLVLLGLTLLVGRSLRSRSIPVVFAGATFAFDSSLYESGIIGNAESLAKAIQIAIVAYVLTLVIRDGSVEVETKRVAVRGETVADPGGARSTAFKDPKNEARGASWS